MLGVQNQSPGCKTTALLKKWYVLRIGRWSLEFNWVRTLFLLGECNREKTLFSLGECNRGKILFLWGECDRGKTLFLLGECDQEKTLFLLEEHDWVKTLFLLVIAQILFTSPRTITKFKYQFLKPVCKQQITISKIIELYANEWGLVHLKIMLPTNYWLTNHGSIYIYMCVWVSKQDLAFNTLVLICHKTKLCNQKTVLQKISILAF